MSRWIYPVFAGALLAVAFAFQTPPPAAAPDRVADPFATGWMLADTNGDGIADFVNGKIVVPDQASAAHNSAAANLAARIAYGSTGLTPPLVIPASADTGDGPRFYIGKPIPGITLETGEGAIGSLAGNLALFANDDAGFDAAAEAYSARAPYQWRVPGDRLSLIADAVRAAAPGATVELAAVTYLHGKAALHRAFLTSRGAVTTEALAKALADPRLNSVHQLLVIGGASAVNPKPEPDAPAAPPAAGAAAAPAAEGGANGAATAAPSRLDLATLFTSRGLFTAGGGRIPVTASLNGHLFVPAGAAGIAMANLAARIGLEATGLTLPLASPAGRATARDVRAPAVLAGDSTLAQEAAKKLRAMDSAAAESETPLSPGEGEIRVVDDAFGRRPAVLATGADAAQSTAIELLSAHLPNLWEQGKQYLSIEEIRYDLHRFFSLRSGVGQSAAALYHLDRWLEASPPPGIKDVKAEVYADVVDPQFADFVRHQVQDRWHTPAQVTAASLRAGTRCCDKNPALHYRAPQIQFQQAAPTFTEDILIPWEGHRLEEAVRVAASRITAGQEVKLVSRVSEGPEQRRKLQSLLKDILLKAGADPQRLTVEVLCAYKQGYSWLMDEIAPALAGKGAASLKIDFAKNVDPTGMRAMHSEARWVHELYPVDELLSRKLNLPLDKISLNEIDPPANGATYRVHAFDAAGKELLTREFTVSARMQPYNGVMPQYEQVQVETGWVRMEAAGTAILDQRIKTDIEEFWDHYQNKTLPQVFKSVMTQAHGELRAEFQPPFDTITLDIHMSEPDYALDLDKERISSLEAIQEDTFYSTETFLGIMGDLETGRPIQYTGRIIPIVHPSEDGKDGRVHIEFYAKAAANPLVRLSWTDASGRRHTRERNLPALSGDMNPRLVQVRTKTGLPGVDRLVWSMPADFLDDRYEDWLKLESQDQVDRSIFSVEKARGELLWLERMHAAGLYRDDLAYPHLSRMGIEFDLPLEPGDPLDGPARRSFAAWSVAEPATPRPMIRDYQPISSTPIVQWEEPISPAESTAILARFAAFPGVNVYWMGRSYLGENIWAADLTLPSPALLRSWPKESTLKAAIVYSGRQHANEVSSTSHTLKLAEELLTDPSKRVLLDKVNVVIHPITNPDGAQLSVDLAKITPDNLLHPGYHGSLAADVSTGQNETDPIYPESRTRKQLIDAWLPDAFLNPHGYPSHEWVQPFSEYTGWVQSRQGANTGRAWWIPRGWFTSMGYLRDEQHPYSKVVAFAIRDRIVEAERGVPSLLPLEDRMNSRYQRFGQRWQPRDMFQPIVNGIRIYMALKGSAGAGRGGAGGDAPAGGAGGAATPGSGGVSGLSPDITWDAAYTEAPDETAHGDYMRLMASAGLAFDYVHLRYLADGDLRVTRTERDAAGGVQFRIDRPRPILPKGVAPIPESRPN